jgi:hypothetical protein
MTVKASPVFEFIKINFFDRRVLLLGAGYSEYQFTTYDFTHRDTTPGITIFTGCTGAVGITTVSSVSAKLAGIPSSSRAAISTGTF